MKFRIYHTIIIAVIMIFVSGCGPSSVVVHTRPEAPVYVRPVAPRSGYIWVEGEWLRHGHHYYYRKGYWAAPRARYHEYRPGHWQQRKNGWYWVPGRWN